VSSPATRIIRPQPGPQEAFLSTRADIAIYGGAAGGGKSYSLELEPTRHVRKPGFRAVIFRRTSPEITNAGGLWDESFNIYPALKGEPNQTEHKWYFPPYDSSIHFSHMQHATDRFGWQGAQIAMVGFDELTSFEEEQFVYMSSRNRTMSGVVPYIRATTNPDADSWVAQLIEWWIDQQSGLPIPERSGVLRWFLRDEHSGEYLWADSPDDLRDPEDPDTEPTSLTFIPAKVQDNKILLAHNPKYLQALRRLSPVERARLLNGNWKIRAAAGVMFNREWWVLEPQRPSDAYVLARVRYWDKAATEPTPKHPNPKSYSVGLLMALTTDGVFHVEDVVRGRWTALDRERTIRQIAQLDGPQVQIWIEQEPGSGGKESAQGSARRLPGWDIRIERVTGEKVVRAQPFSAQVQARNVRVLNAPWTKAFIDEYDAFPQSATKDQVDAGSGAFNKLSGAIMVGPYDPEEDVLPGIPESEYGGQFDP
jgi:predicted phage terminase large subunit-like protein